jgi:ribosome-binding protein aMBF1 (putative translation factor)
MSNEQRRGYFERRREDPAFAAGVRAERERIDAIDAIVRRLDEERERRGLSKAELARLTDKRAEVVRRLFTAEGSNPTLETVVQIAQALDLELTLAPRASSRG